MKEEIKAGDIVYLKSGGPKMTVVSTYVDDSMAECAWFDQNRAEGASFPMEALTKKDPSAQETYTYGERTIVEVEDDPQWERYVEQGKKMHDALGPKTDQWENFKASMGWISVKELLPHEGETHFVYDGTKVAIAMFPSKTIGFTTTWGDPFNEKITHWYQAPQPPKIT